MVTIADALALSGCSKSNESASTTSAGPTNSTVDIRKSGKLVVGVTIPYTPNEFMSSSTDTREREQQVDFVT